MSIGNDEADDEIVFEGIHALTYTLHDDHYYVVFQNCKIEKLTVSGNMTSLICNAMGVKCIEFLDVPNLMFFYCEGNCLENLSIPVNCAMVYAKNNNIKTIVLHEDNTELWYLDIRNNCISSIPFDFPKHFGEIYIQGNPSIHFKSRKWIWKLENCPGVGLCRGDWIQKKGFCQLEIECMYSKMDDPIVI